MAHKKKKHKVSGTRKRHRRVGAVKGSLEHYALLGLGGFAGGLTAAYATQAANTALSSTVANTPWLPPGLVAGAGAAVAIFSKGNAIGEGFGLGMASVGAVLSVNAGGFLNVPGISGVANMSNAPLNSPVIRKALGQAPGPYINQTVGSMTKKYARMGALATN
jgi:hypothetical protein